MQKVDTVKARISKNSHMYILPADKYIDIDNKVFAINWFSTRMNWLYDLYNLLAGPLVSKVGAELFFKAKVVKILHGKRPDLRDTLLIVAYPNIFAFKRLVEMSLFKFVSLFRILAVKEFTFCFTHAVDSDHSSEKRSEQALYAIHHYKGKSKIAKDIEEMIADSDITMFCHTKTFAHLSSGDEDEAKEKIPCLMDGVIVFSAQDQKRIEDFVNSARYRDMTNSLDSSFVALLKRVDR